jgi:Pyruvate/2-oxoacid:ferredoxin oxidoreductase delta subunit
MKSKSNKEQTIYQEQKERNHKTGDWTAKKPWKQKGSAENS